MHSTNSRITLLVGVAVTWCTAAYAQDRAGSVTRVIGTIEALRNPSPTPKSNDRAVKQAKLGNRYWDAYALSEGDDVYFGDLLAASPQGKSRLTLDNGFSLVLAPSSRLAVTRRALENTQSKTVIDLFIGAIRARTDEPVNEDDTEFRVRSMVLGVRGTDFYLRTLPTEAEVVVVEGRVAVRNTLSKTGSEVVLARGQSTTVPLPPLDASFSTPTAPEPGKTVADYDPKPPQPVTREQARQATGSFEGLLQPEEKATVNDLVQPAPASDAKPTEPPPPPTKAADDRRAERWLGLELFVGKKSVSSDAPGLSASGTEVRPSIDIGPFAKLPLRFGLAYSNTTLHPSSAFNDTDLEVHEATESAFALFVRYAWKFADHHALIARIGVRPGELVLQGSPRSGDRGEQIKSDYDVGGMLLGLSYQWTIVGDLSVLAQGDMVMGSIKTKGDYPPERNLTKDPSADSWSARTIGLALRYELF